jgi:1-acyl-sn-glycerol-3-phosphate acyltransferase
MQDLIVSGVKALLRILLRLYFTELRHTKRDIPKEGPLVFLANHQNALLDALLIAAFNRRKTFFLVRSNVFKNRLVAHFLYFFGLRPIYRIRDGREKLALNEPLFDFFAQVLVQGNCVLLFPEGNHALQRTVRPLRKGFIEIIDRAYAIAPHLSLRIVPVGLSYQQPACFFDRAAIQYNPSLDAADLFLNQQDQKLRDKRILDRVHAELCSATVHIPKGSYDEIIAVLGTKAIEFTQVQEVNQTIKKVLKEQTEFDLNRGSLSLPETACTYSFLQRFSLALAWPFTFLWRLSVKPRIKEAEFISTFRFAYFTLWVTLIALMASFLLFNLITLK